MMNMTMKHGDREGYEDNDENLKNVIEVTAFEDQIMRILKELLEVTKSNFYILTFIL